MSDNNTNANNETVDGAGEQPKVKVEITGGRATMTWQRAALYAVGGVAAAVAVGAGVVALVRGRAVLGAAGEIAAAAASFATKR